MAVDEWMAWRPKWELRWAGSCKRPKLGRHSSSPILVVLDFSC